MIKKKIKAVQCKRQNTILRQDDWTTDYNLKIEELNWKIGESSPLFKILKQENYSVGYQVEELEE